MTTAYTSLLGLALPVQGELSGTWGDTVNNGITSLLDSSIAGTQTLTADTTLTTTTGAANQSRQAILLCSPASANITITAPAQSKIYTVINTSAVYTVTVRGVGPTTGVTLGVSEKAVVAWNGSDFIKISNTAGAGTFTNLTVTGVADFADGTAALPSITNTGDTNTGIFFPAADTIAFTEGGAEAMRIDSSGNVGIGVTPSAWLSTTKVLQIGDRASIFTNSSEQTLVGNNVYVNSSSQNTYIETALASLYQQAAGVHYWYNAPSGTAGASAAVTSGQLYTVSVLGSSTLAQWQAFFSALTVLPTVGQVVTATATGSIVGGGTVTQNITFTQAMTLDASGNLGIGVTPSFPLDVQSTGVGSTIASRIYRSDGTIALLRIGNSTSGSGSTAPAFGSDTTSAVIYTNNTVKMTITSAGNVGIGVTTPSSKLQVSDSTNGGAVEITAANTYYLATSTDETVAFQGEFFQNDLSANRAAGYMQIGKSGDFSNAANASAFMAFATRNAGTIAEKMRIDSSGNVGIGTTSTGGYALAIQRTSDNALMKLTAVTSGGAGIDLVNAGGSEISYVGASGNNVLTFRIGGTERVRINSSGNVGIGTTSPTAVLNLKAGTATASTSPLKFTSGTNLTSVEAGSVEYDGNVFYGTADVTSGRGLWPTIQYFRLTADGSAIGPTIANFFGGTSGVTLDTSGFYEVEYNVYFTKTTAGTVTFTLTYANAPINCDANYVGTPVGGVGTVGAPQTAALAKSTATGSALPVTGSLTTAVNHQYVVKAMFQANATTGGTLNLQVTSSAGTVTPLTGSYYKVTRLPAANTGAFV